MSAIYEFWNVLHDGEIVAVNGHGVGSIVLTVEIEYLTNLLPGDANQIHCHLAGCRKFSMNIWENGLITDDLDAIAQIGTEILSTDSESMPVKVITTLGEIQAEYDEVQFTTGDGMRLTFDELCSACDAYWNKWQQDAEQGAQPDAFGTG